MHIADFIRRYVFGDSGQPPPPDLTTTENFPWAGFFARAGLTVGILGTANGALLSIGWFWCHTNVGNGAVLWFAFLCITGFFTFLIGFPCSIIGISKGRRRVGVLGLGLSIAPVPLGFAMLHIAMALNGFRITS